MKTTPIIKKTLVFFTVSILSIAAIISIFLPETQGEYTYDIDTFSDYNELQSFLNDVTNQYSSPYYTVAMDDAKTGGSPRQNVIMESSSSDNAQTGLTDYSETNVQVAGVDEPDIVKTDGNYIYIVSNTDIFIVKAYPASETMLVSTIKTNETNYIEGIFINGDTLVVFSTNAYQPTIMVDEIYQTSYVPTFPKTNIQIYDISDRNNPSLKKTIKIDGSYYDARMIGDMIYVVSIEYAYDLYPTINGNQTLRVPELTIDNETENIEPASIYYVDVPDKVDTMTHVLSIDVNGENLSQKSFFLGYSQTMYVSEHAIYLASNHYGYTPGLLTIAPASETTTIIHKISIDNEIEYTAQGEVPGTILNQFSMDEHNGYFRIATTIGNVWNQEAQSTNNIFVLDEDLTQISSIEDIAPGERIYSARFMGEKAYLVTFKKIDPFFTIDLSDPYHPEILGKLKIPGYSDYLHPYDDDHIIGIGKETVEALEEEKGMRNLDFAWYQGVKMAIFDVTDVTNPTEQSKVVIGDRGTSSPALYDHKAFLFDREKELLVIPVNLYEIPDYIKEQYDNYTGSTYGEFTFQGAYVYDVNLENGFELKGTITHLNDSTMLKSGFYPSYESSITRSLYIDDVLYTISTTHIGVHNLKTLDEIAMISLQ